MPPDGGAAAYPLTIGLTADPGQTAAANATFTFLRRQLEDRQPHAGVVLIAGDLSCALTLTGLGVAWRDLAWRGLACLDLAWLGVAWLRWAWLRWAWRGVAWLSLT
jgi:hypothetical protein